MTRVYDLLLRCPLRKYLIAQKISGIRQYTHEAGLVYRKIFVNILLNLDPFYEITAISPRIQNEIKSFELIRFANEFKQFHPEFKLHKEVYTTVDAIDLHYYIGEYDQQPLIFLFSFGQKVYEYHAVELILAIEDQYGSTPPSELIAAVIRLSVPDDRIFRFFPKEGILTNSGRLNKRDSFGSWAMIQLRYEELLKKYNDEMAQSLFVPRSGQCGTCPYHNVSIILPDGSPYQCIG